MGEILSSLLTPAGITAGVSIVVAVASLVFNVMLLHRQNRMQLESLRLQADSDVIGWGRQAIDALADAQRLIYAKPHITDTAFEQDRISAMQRLSSLADQGRLFFPNVVRDDHGKHNEAAYQGYRQPVLDALIFAYAVLQNWRDAGKRPNEAIDFLWQCRRLVISQIQNSVDPRRRERTIARLAKNRRGGGDSPREQAVALGAALEALTPKGFAKVAVPFTPTNTEPER